MVIVGSLYFWHCVQTYNTDWHFIDNVNFVIHESGHIIFSFFGEFIKIAAGSGFQVLLPFSIALYFFFTRQKISASFCLMWMGQSLMNVSIYANDAIRMQLPLVGGDNVIHDWNYILSSLGILQYTKTISQSIYVLGIVAIFVGTFFALYYAWTEKVQ